MNEKEKTAQNKRVCLSHLRFLRSRSSRLARSSAVSSASASAAARVVDDGRIHHDIAIRVAGELGRHGQRRERGVAGNSRERHELGRRGLVARGHRRPHARARRVPAARVERGVSGLRLHDARV